MLFDEIAALYGTSLLEYVAIISSSASEACTMDVDHPVALLAF